MGSERKRSITPLVMSSAIEMRRAAAEKVSVWTKMPATR